MSWIRRGRKRPDWRRGSYDRWIMWRTGIGSSLWDSLSLCVFLSVSKVVRRSHFDDSISQRWRRRQAFCIPCPPLRSCACLPPPPLALLPAAFHRAWIGAVWRIWCPGSSGLIVGSGVWRFCAQLSLKSLPRRRWEPFLCRNSVYVVKQNWRGEGCVRDECASAPLLCVE